MHSPLEPDPALRAQSSRWRVVLLLTLSAILDAIPFWWGATADRTWAYDEVIPREVFGGRPWRTVYPVFFRYVYRTLLAPVQWLAESADLHWNGGESRLHSLYVMRLLSVVLAVLTVWILYRCGRKLAGPAGAWIAAAAVAFSPVFVYYAKTANLEAAYLFAYALFLLFAIRWLQSGKRFDAALMGLTAALSVGIKDTAFALFPLLPVAFLLPLRRPDDQGSLASWRRLLTDSGLWAGIVSGGALLAVLLGFPWDPTGFLRHFNRGTAMLHGSEREFANTLSGHVALFSTGLVNWAFVLGLPMSVIATLGAIQLWRRRETRAFAALLTLPPISYYALFILPIGFNPARYFLPLAFLAALSAGVWWKHAFERRPRRRWLVAACVLVVGWSLARTVAVDWLMATDSRTAVEKFVAELPAGSRAVAFGRPQAAPRIRTASWNALRGGECAGLADMHADLISVTPQDAWGGPEGGRQPMALLLSGEAGYRRVRLFPRPSLARWLVPPWAHSNLDKISPDVVVLERTESPCRDAAWVLREAGVLLQSHSEKRWESLLEFVGDQDFLGRTEREGGDLVSVGLAPDRTLAPGKTAVLLFSNRQSRRSQPRLKLLCRSAGELQPRNVLIDSGYARQTIRLTGPRLQRQALTGLAPHQRRMILVHNLTSESNAAEGAIWISGDLVRPPSAPAP